MKVLLVIFLIVASLMAISVLTYVITDMVRSYRESHGGNER